MRLRHFKTVVDVGGLMKASEVLGITGGGLSKSIKALEDELGFKLFMQKGRGLELTELGAEFYEKLPTALKVLDDLTSFNKNREPIQNAIKFASFEVFTTYFLGDFIKDYLLDSRRVEIREAIPGEMERLISEGICDIGITYEPIPYRGVEFLKIGKIKMGVYSGKSKKWDSTIVGEIPFVVPINPLEGTPSGVKGLDGWPEHLFERNAQYRVEMMESALQLASQGIAAVFLPSFVKDLFNSQVKPTFALEEIKVPKVKAISRDVFIIKRKNEEETNIVKKLAKSLKSFLSK